MIGLVPSERHVRLAARIALAHPEWSDAKVQAEVAKALAGMGEYAEAPEIRRRRN